jgi:stage III sporulation protein AE
MSRRGLSKLLRGGKALKAAAAAFIIAASAPATVFAPALAATAQVETTASSRDVLTDAARRLFEDSIGLEGLEDSAPDEAREIFGDISVTDAMKPDGLIRRIADACADRAKEIAAGSIRSAVMIIAASAVCSLAGAAFGEQSAEYADLAAVLAISAVSIGDVKFFIGLGERTLDELDAFSKMLIPTLTAAAAGSGAITSAAAKYAAVMLFVNLLISLSRNIVMPLVCAYTAASVARAAAGEGGAGNALASIAGFTGWICKTVLIVTQLAFVAYLSLVGAASGAGDALAERAAKTVISALPVVGGIAADAAGAVAAGAALLRNAAGIFGMLVVAGVCLTPFLRFGVNYLFFKAAGGLAGAFAGERVTRLINAFGSAFALMLGMTGSAAVMLFISIISVTKAVT